MFSSCRVNRFVLECYTSSVCVTNAGEDGVIVEIWRDITAEPVSDVKYLNSTVTPYEMWRFNEWAYPRSQAADGSDYYLW